MIFGRVYQHQKKRVAAAKDYYLFVADITIITKLKTPPKHQLQIILLKYNLIS